MIINLFEIDNYLGICVSQADEPIRESLRSEALFYNTEEDHAPIRIHKYNIDDDEEVDDQTENELVDIKRDNIKDNYMDLERINLYSEKTKRSRGIQFYLTSIAAPLTEFLYIRAKDSTRSNKFGQLVRHAKRGSREWRGARRVL